MDSMLADARHVVVITGAGISAASGIATYRDGGSSWSDARLESISRADRYGNHLDELWAHWGQMRATMTAASPNQAHQAITAAQRDLDARGGSLTVITQNIDGLHGAAGATDVIEIHGSVRRTRCINASCKNRPWLDRNVPDGVPRCACGRPARLDVTLFGEQLSSRLVKQALRAIRRADVCMYVGTSGEVRPVCDWVADARNWGARCVLVNAEQWRWPHPDFHDTYLGPAEELLPHLLRIS